LPPMIQTLYDFMASVQIGRLVCSVPPGLTKDSGRPQRRYEVTLHQFRGSGILWDTFNATCTATPDELQMRLVKLANVSVLPSSPDPTYEDSVPTISEGRRLILNEARLYIGPLRPLQGVVVPHFEGLFRTLPQSSNSNACIPEVWCVLQEDGGMALSKADRLKPVVQRQIVCLYLRLHDAGVIHNDVSWRHILGSQAAPTDTVVPSSSDQLPPYSSRLSSGMVNLQSIRLVDFGNSLSRSAAIWSGVDPNAQGSHVSASHSEDVWRAMCAKEMRAVVDLWESPRSMSAIYD